ncbi:MAG TPA: rhodanese-like domain-containing protein [Kiritimatiellia bacterium]|nr:rhodanese-like domain-containing protein [Kiritimatiellia bacterium]HRZ13702.1 rhodanese-like domain-containing protein [Kiritimatiellia bacterium]HSA19390.1 rhodanese-like domain-containing protein [Kiritimatiellia bacterium]
MKARGILLLGLACAARAMEPAEVYRFGTANLNDRLTNRFVLRNEQPNPLGVQSVTPSCECVHVMRWPTNVEAGAAGEIEILFVPDKAGAVDYRLQVKTSSASMPQLEYAIQGVVTAAPRARVDRDWSLYLGTDEAGALVRDPGRALLVDVRSAQEYERARIPGSLNIPLYAVKAKGFLRGRKVVLVDEGCGSRVLDEECRKLRGMGFPEVWLWYGGLNAWQRRGGPLEGPGTAGMNRITPIALHDIGFSTDWLVIATGGAKTNQWEGGVIIPFNPAKPGDFAAAVNAAIQERPQVGSVLIASDQGGDYEPVSALAGRINGFVFYLEGGWEAWEAHRRMMGAIRQGHTVVAQGSAPGGGTRVRPGCGGCPR